MKIAFKNNVGLNKRNLEKLYGVNGIIEEYMKQGYRLTLRQLYYQLVSRNIIKNDVREYAKLSILLGKGRMAGIVDWDAIEDRVRVPYIPYSCDDPSDGIRDLINQYRLNRQLGQEYNVEVWVEKDALSGVLKRVTNKYHIRLVVNRGYSSITAMYEAAERFSNAYKIYNQKGVILYLGDHDPSGLDMVRDVKDRLYEFGVDVEVVPVALTTEQVTKYNPPPNPAKFKDPRSAWYVRIFGKQSWEVDALRPELLHSILEDSILEYVDWGLVSEVMRQEDRDKETLYEVSDKLKGR